MDRNENKQVKFYVDLNKRETIEGITILVNNWIIKTSEMA